MAQIEEKTDAVHEDRRMSDDLMREKFKNIEESLETILANTKDFPIIAKIATVNSAILLGNGNPDTGLVVRFAKIEKLFWVVFGATVSLAGGLLIYGIKLLFDHLIA